MNLPIFPLIYIKKWGPVVLNNWLEAISKKIKNAKPAQIVEKPKPSDNVRRIKAKDKKKKK